ncbi:MAG: alkaline phosphatase [Robiginitomaculum sp.]|nr:MAG: alkaline phosphatase [Robiginitomaculum sp.]
MTNITRRGALFTGFSLMGASAASCARESAVVPVAFAHGVASGDPGTDKMIIWTRITPSDNTGFEGTIPVKWEIATDAEFRKIRRKGKTSTSAARDFTVKVDAAGLKPGQTYFYRFKVGKTISPVGRTKTLPVGALEQARFAVVSCTNFPFGYFNVYDHIAKQDGFDAVIHLGDYFYEYGTDSYGGKTGQKLGRNHAPTHETVTLSDYRTRHAQYKADTASQAMHAAHPLIAIWDDHETANDSWKSGAQNHNAGEGSWEMRRGAAMQAYYEYMPVRDPVPGKTREALFRDFSFGDLLSLHTLETRLTARTQPLSYEQYVDTLTSQEAVDDFVQNTLWDRGREMLGAGQKDWLAKTLKASKDAGTGWRLIANQVLLGPVLSPDLRDYAGSAAIERIAQFRPSIRKLIEFSPLGLPLSLDSWDGYPAAREGFYALAKKQGVQDLLVLTGDTHVSRVNSLTSVSGENMGVEFGVTGTTSPGHDAYFKDMSQDYEKRLMAKNKGTHWMQSAERGYLDLHLTKTEAHANFISVSTTHTQEYTTFTAKSYTITKDDDRLKLRS